MWKCEDSLNLLLADIFSFAGFPVSSADIRARPESCVYSVTNRETWRSVTSNQAVPVNISKLTPKLQHMGFEEVKPLNVTGGMSFQVFALTLIVVRNLAGTAVSSVVASPASALALPFKYGRHFSSRCNHSGHSPSLLGHTPQHHRPPNPPSFLQRYAPPSSTSPGASLKFRRQGRSTCPSAQNRAVSGWRFSTSSYPLLVRNCFCCRIFCRTLSRHSSRLM